MARVTVEDCITKVPNRFDLVLMASTRARQISAGDRPTLPEDRDKNPVIALREIAENTITPQQLEETIVRSMQRYVEVDEPEEDELTQEMISQRLAEDGGEAMTPIKPAEPEDEDFNDEDALGE